MSLKVIAVSAPNLLYKNSSSKALNSSDPVSLFNACRQAAYKAHKQVGHWKESNWVGKREYRRKSILLMNSFEEDRDKFEDMLLSSPPNLLLIGSMTMCLPGAIELAKIARSILGNTVYIVLGGRHINETVYMSGDDVVHHCGSPIRLAYEGKIEDVFDLVVAGESEYLIEKIGELVSVADDRKIDLSHVTKMLNDQKNIPGRWIASCIEGGHIRSLVNDKELDKDSLVSPAEMFGITTKFDVFDGRYTAHVFSDSTNGCLRDCGFCSERISVTGPVREYHKGPDRLFLQMSKACDVIKEDYGESAGSAFIEDSVVLEGRNQSLQKLYHLLLKANLNIKFGCQFTIDQILDKMEMISKLHEVGLDYIFIGIETLDPNLVGGIHKNFHSKETWVSRAERVICFLSRLGIKVGGGRFFLAWANHIKQGKT